MDPDKTYANLLVSRDTYNQFRATCDRTGQKYGPVVDGLMTEFVRAHTPTITILGRKIPLSAPCSRCGTAYRDLNVCNTGAGEPLFLCRHCTEDLAGNGGE